MKSNKRPGRKGWKDILTWHSVPYPTKLVLTLNVLYPTNTHWHSLTLRYLIRLVISSVVKMCAACSHLPPQRPAFTYYYSSCFVLSILPGAHNKNGAPDTTNDLRCVSPFFYFHPVVFILIVVLLATAAYWNMWWVYYTVVRWRGGRSMCRSGHVEGLSLLYASLVASTYDRTLQRSLYSS